MRAIASLLLMGLLAGCGLANRIIRSDLEGCGLGHGGCNPEQTAAVSERALRALESSLRVDCGIFGEAETQFRDRCKARVALLVHRLSGKFAGRIELHAAEVEYEESETCLDTFIPGREAADCAFVSSRAVIPLHWLGGGGI
jgi:xanthine/CO dehydrogenase XdhC/CoxF family maturation factor